MPSLFQISEIFGNWVEGLQAVWSVLNTTVYDLIMTYNGVGAPFGWITSLIFDAILANSDFGLWLQSFTLLTFILGSVGIWFGLYFIISFFKWLIDVLP